ncbi:putative cubilin [Dirofilaria immitis]|nr:putative cubilin [Dirofilaria immitis]
MFLLIGQQNEINPSKDNSTATVITIQEHGEQRWLYERKTANPKKGYDLSVSITVLFMFFEFFCARIVQYNCKLLNAQLFTIGIEMLSSATILAPVVRLSIELVTLPFKVMWKSVRWSRCCLDLLLFAILLFSPSSSESNQEINLFNEDDSRSRLLMLDGNMYFHAARQKNITFIAGTGGSIYLGDKNLNFCHSWYVLLKTEFESMKEEMDETKDRVHQLVRMTDLFKQQIKLKSGDVAALNRKNPSLRNELYWNSE